ncbi:hypothetical protein ANN_01437 [Periplaneta americana]|uniref:Uncharacterized protein n=1 Tax=Periplaneta americana TaxID=6978 RepID=A0ABQ8TXM9_PERAM|nr:hypothetical protein ANN_01437 [Periplaneta americana]
MTSSCAFKCRVTAATLWSKPEIDWKKCEEGMSVTAVQIPFKSYGAMYATPEPHNVVVITEDVQNVHLLLEYRPHIDVSLTCEHDPKLQEYCVCPQNMPQFDSERIPNQAPETNKPMILNGPTSRNREGSDQETFDPSTGEPYD